MRARTPWVRTGLVMAVLVVSAFGLSKVVPAKMGSTKAFVTNSLGDTVTVIDLGTMKATGTIKVGKRVHGVCAPADGQKFFVTIELERTFKVVDTSTNEVTATIQLPGVPNQCASTPDGHYVGVPIRSGDSVAIIDIQQSKIVKVLPVKKPHNCYNAGSNDVLYVSSMGDNEIERIDLKTMEYTDKIPTAGIPRPYAVTRNEKTLYVALSDYHGFEIVDVASKKETAKVDLPAAPPADCELEPHTETHGLALSPNEKELWVTSLTDGGVYVYDIATKKISKEIGTGQCPNWIGFSPDGKFVTVSNCGSNDATIIDAKTRQAVATVKTGEGPKRLVAMVVPAP
jgi:YVTN family beta-propeller protein